MTAVISTSAAPQTDREYAAAINALNSLQSNAATIEAIRKNGPQNHLALPEMIEYLKRIGYSCTDLDKLNIIHITGTKGKGSTAAFCDAILRQVSQPDTKVGLYTSPHMVSVRERIRINGEPLAEDLFVKYFWEVWDRLGADADREHSTTPLRPVYFRYMTLLAFHIFSSLQVSATILEVGIGGMYDSTNIVPHSIVAGITALGLDHVAVLGNTLELIAEQKAGIFKEGCYALTVPQKEGSMDVIKSMASQRKVATLDVISPINSLPALGLPGVHQVSNASLAVAIARKFLSSPSGRSQFPLAVNRVPTDLGARLSEVEQTGLSTARWPGRCQTVLTRRGLDDSATPGTSWFLDGAHTTDSLALCAEWFVDASEATLHRTSGTLTSLRMLIFNCTNGRAGYELLHSLFSAIEGRAANSADDAVGKSSRQDGHPFPIARNFLTDVIFCTNTTYSNGGSAGDLTSLTVDANDIAALKTQFELKTALSHLLGEGVHAPTVHVVASIQDAMRLVDKTRKPEVSAVDGAQTQSHCLVTGSLHLVGGVLAHLKDRGWVDESLRSTIEVDR